MIWLRTYPEPVPYEGQAVVAIGNFDGVHAGHRQLLAVAKTEASDKPLIVLTFEPHPRSVLRPEIPVKRLTTLKEKMVLLAAAGVDGVAVLGFDLAVAAMEPAAFEEAVLIRWVRAHTVFVGENFRYGRRAGGDVATLAANTTFTTRAVPLLTDEGGVVSSSRLRLS